MTGSKLVDYLYYQTLPQVYRDMDNKLITRPLYRYLQALSEGGYEEVLEDVNGVLDLVDPEKCPDKCFPILCECFGVEYCEDIPLNVQRKLIMNIGEMNRRRGTHASVEYLVRVLTNLDSEQAFEVLDNGEKQLKITLFARNLAALKNLSASIKIIENYIRNFVPYYIVPIIVDSRLATQDIKGILRSRAGLIYAHTDYAIGEFPKAKNDCVRKTEYTACLVMERKHYDLIPQ